MLWSSRGTYRALLAPRMCHTVPYDPWPETLRALRYEYSTAASTPPAETPRGYEYAYSTRTKNAFHTSSVQYSTSTVRYRRSISAGRDDEVPRVSGQPLWTLPESTSAGLATTWVWDADCRDCYTAIHPWTPADSRPWKIPSCEQEIEMARKASLGLCFLLWTFVLVTA